MLKLDLDDWARVPANAIKSFEIATEIRITVHDLIGPISHFLLNDQTVHTADCCRAVKAKTGPAACLRSDQDDVRAALNREPRAGLHVCHAGFLEWVAPVRYGDELAAVLFAGPCNPRRLVQLRLPVRDNRKPKFSAGLRATLPDVTDDQALHHLELLRQLAARLERWLIDARPHLHSDYQTPGGGRSARRALAIHRFVLANHTQRLRLQDLADHLHLSPSRASHAVVEATGKNFQTLLTEARIKTASAILRGTDLPIAEVARRCGIPHVAQFHRTFRQALGQTPAEHRQTSV